MNGGEDIFVTIIGLVITYIVGPIVVYKIAAKKARLDFHDKALQNRYNLVYCPLRSLLLETHITGASSGFYWKQRIERAIPYFKKLDIMEGFRRLDKKFGSNPVYEVEFGEDFPLNEIIKIVKKQSQWADSTLLNLVQAADRSTYEAHQHGEDDGLLEKEKFELADYIWDTYEKLNRRLVPQLE